MSPNTILLLTTQAINHPSDKMIKYKNKSVCLITNVFKFSLCYALHLLFLLYEKTFDPLSLSLLRYCFQNIVQKTNLMNCFFLLKTRATEKLFLHLLC